MDYGSTAPRNKCKKVSHFRKWMNLLKSIDIIDGLVFATFSACPVNALCSVLVTSFHPRSSNFTTLNCHSIAIAWRSDHIGWPTYWCQSSALCQSTTEWSLMRYHYRIGHLMCSANWPLVRSLISERIYSLTHSLTDIMHAWSGVQWWDERVYHLDSVQ